MCTALYEHKSSKKTFKLFENPKKKLDYGPILGQDRPEKNSVKCLFEAARFRVLNSTSIDKTNNCAMNIWTERAR